jgi:transcriptional regulator with XRE-family HTH domain
MEQDKTLLLQLGERVKALRVTRGLSQEELAERAGMSLKHLGEIERAATEPSITAVLGLCKGLEVRVLELLPDPARITPEPKALSRDDWQRILDITKSLADTAEGMVRFAGRFQRPPDGAKTVADGTKSAARRLDGEESSRRSQVSVRQDVRRAKRGKSRQRD